jgi:hypothetical protein
VFSDCVVAQPIYANEYGVTLPPLQFRAPLGLIEKAKGISEVCIHSKGRPDVVYQFGMQFIEDTNQTAYVVEEPISVDGTTYDFLPPHRPHHN